MIKSKNRLRYSLRRCSNFPEWNDGKWRENIKVLMCVCVFTLNKVRYLPRLQRHSPRVLYIVSSAPHSNINSLSSSSTHTNDIRRSLLLGSKCPLDSTRWNLVNIPTHLPPRPCNIDSRWGLYLTDSKNHSRCYFRMCRIRWIYLRRIHCRGSSL
jgi:hypothetical protein